MAELLTMHPGHDINVTGGGPFGRAWFDCSCGIARTHANKREANRSALVHHHDVGGCNCPTSVREHPVHPATDSGASCRATPAASPTA